MVVSTVVASGVVVTYLALFGLQRRPSAIRLQRLGYLVSTLIVFNAIVRMLDPALLTTIEFATWLVSVGGAVALMSSPRVWVFRQSESELREAVNRSCARLLITVEEKRLGTLVFTAGDRTYQMRWVSLGRRLMLARLPRRRGRDKVTLWLDWLGKQYPGPIPRFRISYVKESGR